MSEKKGGRRKRRRKKLATDYSALVIEPVGITFLPRLIK